MLGPQFKYFAPDYSPEAWDTREEPHDHLVEASIHDSFGPMKLGSLSWAPTGRISDIHVEPHARRKGIATAMYEYAKNLGVGQPEHSAQRTDLGEAWAQSLGEELTPRDESFR